MDPKLNPLLQAGGLVVLFGLWLSVHLALSLGLALRTELRGRALFALLPPLCFLAPWWGLSRQRRTLSVLWALLLSAYVSLLLCT